jgi:hypothetical protein
MTTIQGEESWRSAWPDALAFGSVLFLAWWAHARVADLVWSLWLSSLVVGYSIIVWSIFRPVITGGFVAWRERGFVREAIAQSDGRTIAIIGAVGVVGGLFVLAFFTVHFFGFHYVHSGFLNHFFPVGGDYDGARPLEGMALYREVLRRYWLYLPAAFLGHRAAFNRPSPVPAGQRIMGVTAEAIAARKAAVRRTAPAMMQPYADVMRMHMLIFFLAFAHFARLDNFLVYAVVYAVYFFPWRLVKKTPPATQAATA